MQKERLHAELKHVLSLKRTQLRASSRRLTRADMDSSSTEEQTLVRPVGKYCRITH